MTVEKLERVMLRMRRRNPGKDRIIRDELHRAIMLEIGVNPRTYKLNKDALTKLQWIRSDGPRHIKLTGKDLDGDF